MEATASPCTVYGSESNSSRAPLAELARHMAIVGSYALSCDDDLKHQKTCYPIVESTLLSPVLPGPSVTSYRLVARKESIDLSNNRGVAVSEAFDQITGELIASLRTEYNVIPADQFFSLTGTSSDSISTTTDDTSQSMMDPKTLEMLPLATLLPSADTALNCRHSSGSSTTVLAMDMVPLEICAGHFDEMPAFPVSYLVRYIMQAITHGVKHSLGYEPKGIRVLWGQLKAHRFLRAGEGDIRIVVSRQNDISSSPSRQIHSRDITTVFLYSLT